MVRARPWRSTLLPSARRTQALADAIFLDVGLFLALEADADAQGQQVGVMERAARVRGEAVWHDGGLDGGRVGDSVGMGASVMGSLAAIEGGCLG